MLATSMRGPPKPLPAGISRPEVIRNLSVFVSYLDSVFRPDNANHAIAMQASATITRTLDEVLDPTPQPVGSSGQDQVVMGGLLTPSASTPSAHLGAGNMEVDAALVDPFLGVLDEQGFNDWMGSIDWTATGSGWSTL